MSRFYFRLILIPTALFTFVLILIHAQPYDDHELRELLLPEGCPAPCFMGIRPGVTTVDEAIKILKASGWVEINPAQLKSTDVDFPLILRWNGKQPALLNADEGFGLAITFRGKLPKKVGDILFNLSYDITLGDLYLILGKSSLYSRTTPLSPNKGYGLIVSHQFEHNVINVLTITDCPISFDGYWHQISANLNYGDPHPRIDLSPSNLKTVLHDPQCR